MRLGEERNVELSSLRPLLPHLSLLEGGYVYYDKNNVSHFAFLVKLDKQYDYAIIKILSF